jgi:hypothetical protein
MLHYHAGVRTTIEITEEQREALAKLAAERGEKGFSRFVQEALDRYLREQKSNAEKIKASLAALDSFSEKEVDDMEEAVRAVRSGKWR